VPIDDLEELGYTIWYPPEGLIWPTRPVVTGHGKQWDTEDGDERVIAEATNHKKLADKLEQAQTYFAGAYVDWPTMTNAQKDAAMRNAMRALSNLIRHARNDLTSEGV
jgi:hypothetical protein